MRFAIKNIMWVFAASVAIVFTSSAQTIKLSVPPRTEKISEEKRTLKDTITTYEYVYNSELSKDEIIKFYKDVFSAFDMHDFGKSRGDDYMFESPPEKIAHVIFTSPQSDGKTGFSVIIYEMSKCPVLPYYAFTSPEKLDFAPVYANSMQFAKSSYFFPMTGVGYLTHSSFEEVVKFYIDDMASFGWTLSERKKNSGMYDFSQWILIVDPFTKAVPLLEAQGYQKKTPPLKIKGETLVFKQNKKKCTITVYNFEDIVEKLEGTIWDAGMVKQYGNTAIIVYYFSE
ncbi:MAG: hypothetical protein WC546_05035 [Candidatus Omnitrophota bacterium]